MQHPCPHCYEPRHSVVQAEAEEEEVPVHRLQVQHQDHSVSQHEDRLLVVSLDRY